MSVTAVRPTAPQPGAPDRAGRRHRFGPWVLIAVLVVVFAALTAAVQGHDRADPTALDPDSATASGSRALVRVLEQRGTRVDVTSRADAVDGRTVLVDDPRGVLDPAVARRIARQADHVVLITSDATTLDAFGVGAEPSADVRGRATVSTASCTIPAAAAAGSVSAAGASYRVTDRARSDGDVEVCAPSGSGDQRAWGLVRATTPGGDVTVLGTTAALRNDTITTAGNAALALGLLGSDDQLTWYTPVPGGADAAPVLGDLAPPWVPSVLAFLGLTAVAAAVWRGRRLGPLVVERLPVVVRAAETTEGRARLYARTRDRTHALDTLRVAAIRRIGRALGLPRSAHVDEVVRAAARATGIPDARVGAVLVGGPVQDDPALVRGAAALDDLERAVRRSTSGDPVASSDHDRDRPGARP
ncbi:DUF4350 domain-containing protein [Curtobacterium sp. ISL-83]|uniref:DUF4350 domain-containing protein n=1 Tax=Curtobacterium sp. ISL-83 TaxID=2819145 RepID=UPI001BE7FFE1|nr:DUF4350 domain-containing protein [Curtobacterium sp. ISL-83]MBT2503110.1 DUF4350 domain-containing protein [Curtobacterium sp. ISL-83]